MGILGSLFGGQRSLTEIEAEIRGLEAQVDTAQRKALGFVNQGLLKLADAERRKILPLAQRISNLLQGAERLNPGKWGARAGVARSA